MKQLVNCFLIGLLLSLLPLVGATAFAVPVLNYIILSDVDSGNTDYANELTVQVDPDVQDPTEAYQIIMSEDPAFAGASWIPYSDPTSYTFNPGEGDHTLYAKVRNSSFEESGVCSDSILIDTIVPNVTADELPPQVYDPVVQVNYSINDPPNSSPMRFVWLHYKYEDQPWVHQYLLDTPPTGSFTFDTGLLPTGSGYYYFEITGEDWAGNVENPTDNAEAFTYVYKDDIGLLGITLSDQDSGDTHYTDEYTVRVDMNVGDPADAAWMKLSENSNFSGASWQQYQNPTTFTLSQGEGEKTVYCKLATNEFVETPPQSASIIVSFEPMSLDGVLLQDIDSGNQDYTNELLVQVTLTVSGIVTPTYMQASENSDFSGAQWMDYQPVFDFTLSSGDGVKTVYVRVANDQYYPSNTNQDSIILDTLPPNSTLGELPDSTDQTVLNIPFSTQGGDPPGSPIAKVELWYSRSEFRSASSVSPLGSSSVSPLQPPGWTLYDHINAPGGSFQFDSSSTGGPGFYQFISIAEDEAGNRKPWPANAEQEVVIFNPDLIGPKHHILTPNGDSYNDETTFLVPNPHGAAVYLYIYSQDRTLVYQSASVAPSWDGRDNSGVLLPAGVYIYQMIVEGEVYNGTVVVAR
jgi:hypothetical protein